MHVAMLGPLEVHDDGGVVPVAGTRLRSLLIRLALDAGRTVTADALAHALWSDDQPADPVNALQSLVSRLRRTLGGPPELHSEPGGYRLDLARGAVDVLAFEDPVADRRLLAGGDADRAVRRLRKALALWRGSALTDAADAPFASGVTVRLDELRATATEECVAAELAAASPPGPLVGELRELVARHPLRDRARGLLLRALHADGRQAEALRAYDDYRRMLADELGADPGPELQSIHLAVLRGEGGPAPAPAQRSRGNLQAPLTSFVGRDVERMLIAKHLDDGHRLITLAGPGGAGKTRLATTFAAGIAGDAPGGVWLVELAPITPTDDVARAVAGVLGLHAEVPTERSIPARDATTRLVEALSATETLLVLDNCEHVADAVARLVDDLLGRCPRLRVLATSREPLGILGEALCHVPPLPVPPPRTGPGEAITFPAVRLFADRAAAVQAGFAVTEDNAGAVVEICRRLDGLPLAIELAAARLRSLTLAQVAAGLDDRFDLLIGGIRTAVPRHRTLRAVIAWSWGLLDDDERRLAERLAVFSGTFTADSAAHMCTVSPPVSRPAREALSGLVDKSLVRISDAPQARYRMLESIREYGMQRLAEAGAAGALRDAHAAHFPDLAERAQAHVVAGGQLPWIHRLRAEHDNLLAALHWAHDVGDADTAVRLGAALSLFWTVRGSHVDAANWLGLALDVPGDAPEAARTIAASVYLFHAALAGGDVDAGTVELLRARLDHVGPVSSSGDLALIEAVVGLVDEDTAARVLATDGRPAHPEPWKRGVQRLTYAMLLGNGGDGGDGRRVVGVGRRVPRGGGAVGTGDLADVPGDGPEDRRGRRWRDRGAGGVDRPAPGARPRRRRGDAAGLYRRRTSPARRPGAGEG